MAKIKKTMTVSLEEFGKKAGEYALDEFEYKGLTIRQWADKITSGEYQPVKHGRWESQELAPHLWRFCSLCGFAAPRNYKKYQFCPNCGCKMGGDSE